VVSSSMSLSALLCKLDVNFLLLQEIDERRSPRGLLASHSVRLFVQKNSGASSACQTAFVFELDSLSSLQAKRAKVVNKNKIVGRNLTYM
jgi:hypothetical protein